MVKEGEWERENAGYYTVDSEGQVLVVDVSPPRTRGASYEQI